MLQLLTRVFGVTSLILKVVDSLTKKFVGDEVVGRDVGLLACETDVLLRVQQSCPDTIITVTVSTAGYHHSVRHQVIANGTQELVRNWVCIIFRGRLIVWDKWRSLLFPLGICFRVDSRYCILPGAG